MNQTQFILGSWDRAFAEDYLAKTGPDAPSHIADGLRAVLKETALIEVAERKFPAKP